MSYGDDVLLDELLNPFHRPGQGWYDTKPETKEEDKYGAKNNKKIHRHADGNKSVKARR